MSIVLALTLLVRNMFQFKLMVAFPISYYSVVELFDSF